MKKGAIGYEPIHRDVFVFKGFEVSFELADDMEDTFKIEESDHF